MSQPGLDPPPTTTRPNPPKRSELTPQMRSRTCELRKVGLGPTRIHRLHPEISINTIKTTLRPEKDRDDNKTRSRSGAPRKLTDEQRDHLFALSQKPGIKMSELVKAVDGAVHKQYI